LWKPPVAWAARSYITGTNLEDGLKASRTLQAHGFKSTICFWDGEGDTTEGIVANYDAIILRIEELKSHCYISVKPWPLKHSADLFRHFSQEAKSRGVKMHFDIGVNERSGTDAVLDSRPGAHLRHAELYLARALASKRCGYRVGH